MDFDYDDKLIEALAEVLGVSYKVVEALELELQMDIGHDDMLYGYYIEYPQKENINNNILQDISETDMRKIPWGKTEFYSESQLGNTDADPFGWKEEWEQERYIQSLQPTKENIIEKLEKIRLQVNENSLDELFIKALIFSAFSITESYTNSLVISKIPNFDLPDLDNNLKIILQKDLKQKLNKNETRIKLYSDFTGDKLKSIPYLSEIRNQLAHNMFSAEIVDDNIIIKLQNSDEKSFNINLIFDSLKDYINNPIK